jgi:hypothetical protein
VSGFFINARLFVMILKSIVRAAGLCCLVACASGADWHTKTVLGIDGDRFTINGKPEFLLGISAFDAVGHRSDQDLDRLRERGFRLMRVWGYWEQVILNSQAPQVPGKVEANVWFRPDGSLDPEKLRQLKDLLERADRRGMVLDLTVFNTFDSFPGDYLPKSEKGLKELTAALRGYRNLLFDVYNEHNNSSRIDPFTISHQQLAGLVRAVKEIDPGRIVTASGTHRQRGAEWGDDLAREWREELATGVDCFTPHLPRTPDFAARTKPRVEWIRALLKSSGHNVPLYLQEEARRRHSGLNPTAREFLLAARGAKEAGAAAWVFHTDAGYHFSLGGLFDRMDPVERSVADEIGKALRN